MNLLEVFALSHFYVGAGLGHVEELPQLPPTKFYTYDQNATHNPLGIAVMGYEWEPARTITIQAEYRHQSFIIPEDNGQNSWQLMVYWRPFRR